MELGVEIVAVVAVAGVGYIVRVALLSDIHANQRALDAVLAQAAAAGVDEYWFLGDAVGYGPDPASVVQWLRGALPGCAAPAQWVLGNHDAMMSDLADDGADGFNVGRDLHDNNLRATGTILAADDWQGVDPNALGVIVRHRQALAGGVAGDIPELFNPGRKSPVRVSADGMQFVLVHSGQVSNLMRYIYAWQEAQFLPDEFMRLDALGGTPGTVSVQCFGHTHVPTLVKGAVAEGGAVVNIHATKVVPGEEYALDGSLILLNPGSVGQPRDLCTRAAYALLDTVQRSVKFCRVQYFLGQAIMSMQIEYYPVPVVQRLRSARADENTPAEWLAHYQVVAGGGCG